MTMKLSMKNPILTRLAVLLLALLPVLSACKKETDLQKGFREQEEKYKAIDDQLIQDYFSRHKITSKDYTRLESGIYLVNIAAGTGENLKAGQTVQVKYTGRFITPSREDVIFDQSFGNRSLCECFEVVIDQSAVIKGWHEALKNMKLGGRQDVFIPSYMAYGAGGSAATIPPNEPLKFYMEIAKVR
ncbi:FKBP-type peptidyl-prolyl cis-trans isomerase [Hymenobacter fastidiosus]